MVKKEEAVESEIVWQDPPKQPTEVTHPLMVEVAKRPGEWALVETLEAGEIAEFHDAFVSHPHYELTMVPQDPDEKYECKWDVYVRFVVHDHPEPRS